MLFIGQQYLVSVAVLNSIAFYGILFPSFIAYWFFNKASIRTVAWFPSTLHILCLLAYILLNATVLNYSHETLAKNACDVVATVVFFVSSLAYFAHLPEPSIDRFFCHLAITACLSAVISMGLFYIGYPPSVYDGTRLSPIGRAGNPILGALLYGIAGLGAVHIAETSDGTRARVLYSTIAGVLGGAILLTGSRMPSIDYVMCLILGIAAYRRSIVSVVKVVGTISITSVIIVVIIGVHRSKTFVATQLVRGDSLRLELLKQTLVLIKERPLLGHGLQARLMAPFGAPEAYNPHNLYLATALYAGIPAALLFVVIVVACLRGSVGTLICKKERNKVAAIVFIFGCISGLSDHAQLVKGPSPLWLIFWMPMACAMARQIGRVRDMATVKGGQSTSLGGGACNIGSPETLR